MSHSKTRRENNNFDDTYLNLNEIAEERESKVELK
jgi:hypothetical protein